jgi:hypothetical protein
MSLEDDVMEAIARHQNAARDTENKADLARIPVIPDWAVDLAARLEAMPGVSPYNSLPVYLRVSADVIDRYHTIERYEMVGRGWDLSAEDSRGEISKAIILMDDGMVRTGGGNAVPRPRAHEGFDPDHQRVIIAYNERVLSKLDESSRDYDECRRLFGVGGIAALTLGTMHVMQGRLSWRCS